jgi:hypothetical protein
MSLVEAVPIHLSANFISTTTTTTTTTTEQVLMKFDVCGDVQKYI